MTVFARLFGKLAEHITPGNVHEALHTHIGAVPNPLSQRSKELKGRIDGAQIFHSVCPYCAVGCGQRVYVKAGKILSIEGDPESPISGGTLCPKGSASYQLVVNPRRWTTVKYRAPYSNEWEEKSLEWAMQRIAQRIYETREATFEAFDDEGHPLNRTLGMGSLGGATLDNEENYLMAKLFHSWGMVSIENQARI
jgi:formate dehydrogenase major subunit